MAHIKPSHRYQSNLSLRSPDLVQPCNLQCPYNAFIRIVFRGMYQNITLYPSQRPLTPTPQIHQPLPPLNLPLTQFLHIIQPLQPPKMLHPRHEPPTHRLHLRLIHRRKAQPEIRPSPLLPNLLRRRKYRPGRDEHEVFLRGEMYPKCLGEFLGCDFGPEGV